MLRHIQSPFALSHTHTHTRTHTHTHTPWMPSDCQERWLLILVSLICSELICQILLEDVCVCVCLCMRYVHMWQYTTSQQHLLVAFFFFFFKAKQRSLFHCHVDLILKSSASKFCLSSFNCNRKRKFFSEVHQVTCWVNGLENILKCKIIKERSCQLCSNYLWNCLARWQLWSASSHPPFLPLPLWLKRW